MNFGTGAARAGLPHGPVIVFLPKPKYPAVRNTDAPVPNLESFIVIGVDRDIQLFFSDLVDFGHQFPSIFDSFFLKIIAEGKISQHLEEGVVFVGLAHLFEIVMLPADPHAFLHRSGSVIAS